MSQTSIGYLLALLTAVCWAILAIMLKKSLEFSDAATIASMRLIFASAGLALYFAFSQPKKIKILKEPPLLGCLAAVFLAFNYFGFTKGVELISASHAQVMIQLGPLLLLISGVIFFAEKIGKKEFLGICIATIGYYLFYNQQLASIASSSHGLFNSGNIWLVLASITWAAFASFQKVLFKKYSPAQLNLLIYLVAGLCLAPLSDFSKITQFGGNEWFMVLALVLNTIIAYGAFAEALNRIPAGHLSLIITLNPILTLIIIQIAMQLNWSWIPNEPISQLAFVGALLVITGIAITVFKSKKIKNRPKS